MDTAFKKFQRIPVDATGVTIHARVTLSIVDVRYCKALVTQHTESISSWGLHSIVASVEGHSEKTVVDIRSTFFDIHNLTDVKSRNNCNKAVIINV